MTQPLTQNLPQYSGSNRAPLKPLLALREPNGDKSPYSSHYLADAIKEKYSDYIKRDEPTFREIISVGQMTALFIEGKQILDWNPYTQSFTPRKLKNSDPNKIKAVNMMQYYCSEWQSKWGSSNPDIIIEPLSNDDEAIAKARKANAVVENWERGAYDAWYNYHEGMMAQVFGWYGNRVRTCNKNGQILMQPIMGEKEVQIGKGYGKCHDCDHSGNEFNSVEIAEGQSMPLCPSCGSTAVNYEPPISQLMPMIMGQQPVRIPDIIVEQLPFPACRWNPKFRAEDSSWFIYEQEVGLSTIRKALGNIRVPEGESGNEIGMDVMRSLGRTGAPLSGRSTTGNITPKEETGLISEFYLSADDLYDIKIQGDEDTVDGEKLPKGARASEVFPEGCCAVLLNGKMLVGLYEEHHSTSVTSGVYHMKPLTGTGRGVADAVEIQKRFNREDSANVRHMETRARPATLHMAGALSIADRKLLGQPDVDIPVNMQNFPEVRSLSDIIMPLQGQSIPGDVMQYTYQYLQEAMQRAYHTTNLGGANPAGIQNNTATYAEINAQNSDALFTPTLTIKADVRLKTAKKAFYLWVKNNPVARFVAYDKANKGGARGISVSGADVDGEYNWSVSPGSELPSDKLTKRKDMVNFYSLFGGIVPYLEAKQMSPQEVSETERAFDMDFSTEDYDEIGAVCRTRLVSAKELIEEAEGMREQVEQQYGVEAPEVDPMMIMNQVKPLMLTTESKLDEKALWFSNLLDTDEGQAMSDEERLLVDALIKTTAKLAQGQAIDLQTMANETEVEASAPIREVQAQEMAGQADQQHKQQLEQNQQTFEHGLAQQKQASDEGQETAEADHTRAMEHAGVQLAGSLMQAQMKNAGSKDNKKTATK